MPCQRVAEGTKTLTGRVVDSYGAFREAANITSSRDTSLSGGQMQLIAVCVLVYAYIQPEIEHNSSARSFMRSVVQEDSTCGPLPLRRAQCRTRSSSRARSVKFTPINIPLTRAIWYSFGLIQQVAGT